WRAFAPSARSRPSPRSSMLACAGPTRQSEAGFHADPGAPHWHERPFPEPPRPASSGRGAGLRARARGPGGAAPAPPVRPARSFTSARGHATVGSSMGREKMLRFLLVNGAALGLGAFVATSCIGVDYPLVAFRCDPAQDSNCPDTHFCCSDDPAAV